MKKIILISIILTVARLSCAQQLFFAPIIGAKADITRIPFYEKHLDIPDYKIIDEHRYWFTFNPKPVFGARVELELRRNTFSAGILLNDHVNSRYEYSFMALQGGQSQLVSKTIYGGFHVLKIPLTYQYEWFKSANKKFTFKFHLGANLLIPQKWGNPYQLIESETYILAEGVSAGKEIQIDSYLINAEYFGQSKLKATIDLGVNLCFKINSLFHINASLYFEKGYKKSGVSALNTEFIMDGNSVLSLSNGSTGSALHLKVVIPILLKDYKKQ